MDLKVQESKIEHCMRICFSCFRKHL